MQYVTELINLFYLPLTTFDIDFLYWFLLVMFIFSVIFLPIKLFRNL